MRRHTQLAFHREGFPGVRHDEQLPALIFVLRMMRKAVALAGVPPIGRSFVKGMISAAKLHIFGAAVRDKNIPLPPQIAGHTALLSVAR
jgi:hypothetical protein